jgi:hypothetical protein
VLALAGAIEEELGGEEGPDLTWGPGRRNLEPGPGKAWHPRPHYK